MPRSPSASLANVTLGVIGFGNLAEALISGALQKRVLRPRQILAVAHRAERDNALKRKYGVGFAADHQELCRKADVLLLAVKPQQMQTVLALLRPHYRGQLVVTVAAGLSLRYYQRYLGKKAPLIRAMPNTCAFLGMGAAGYYATPAVTKSMKSLCEAFFGATGLIRELPREKLIDAVIAVSGSGPAFLYKYAQAVVEGGRKLGLDRATATTLAYQTLAGAARMLMTSGKTPDELIAQVASKRGTTLAGLAVLEKKKFTGIIQESMKKAVKRAREISAELEKK